jgi:FkbM family methyltransferase
MADAPDPVAPEGVGGTGEFAADLTRKFLERISVTTVAQLAVDFAPTPVLRLEPGWRFGSGEERGDPMVVVRLEFWRYFAERRLAQPIVIPWFEGLRARLFLGNDLSRCVYVGGSFEPNEFLFWKTVLKPGMVFLDGGANEGLYTLFAARAVGEQGLVIAVEPGRREFERLRANMKLNGCRNARHVQAALYGATGRGSLAIAEYGHEGQNTLGRKVANPNVATIGTEEVDLTTLDRLVKAERLSRLDGVKLDLEGSEARALAGARRVIDEFRPLLQIELSEDALRLQDSSRAAIVDLLRSVGYRLFVFDRTSGQLRRARSTKELDLNVIAGPEEWRPPVLLSTG